MTEAMTTTSGTEEERPRCEAGSKTDHQCWREATERLWPEDRCNMNLCAEHKRAIDVGREADDHVTALYKMQEWIAAEVKGEEETILQRHAYTMREAAEAAYWPVAVSERAADLIAAQPEGERPLTLAQAERLAELLLRADALADARVILEDAPEEVLGARGRWQIVAGLKAVGGEMNEEVARYRRSLDIR